MSVSFKASRPKRHCVSLFTGPPFFIVAVIGYVMAASLAATNGISMRHRRRAGCCRQWTAHLSEKISFNSGNVGPLSTGVPRKKLIIPDAGFRPESSHLSPRRPAMHSADMQTKSIPSIHLKVKSISKFQSRACRWRWPMT